MRVFVYNLSGEIVESYHVLKLNTWFVAVKLQNYLHKRILKFEPLSTKQHTLSSVNFQKKHISLKVSLILKFNCHSSRQRRGYVAQRGGNKLPSTFARYGGSARNPGYLWLP